MGSSFGVLLPVTLALFGVGFIIAWLSGSRPALHWGLGFLGWAITYLFYAPFAAPFGKAGPIFANAIFIASIFFLMHGVQVRAGRPNLLVARLVLSGLVIAFIAWSTLNTDSRLGEFAGRLTARGLLGGIAIVAIARFMPRPIDKALFAATLALTLNNFTMGSILFLATLNGNGATIYEHYGLMLQVGGNLFGVIFALTAFAAIILDVAARYQDEAAHDPMTGLLNRRGFERAVETACANGPPSGNIVVADIDHFKRINDRFGHDAGDRAIIALADIIRNRLPPDGVAARLGGEEFLVWLPSASAMEAKRFAETVREGLVDHDWGALAIDTSLTASFGVSVLLATDPSPRDAITRADEALFEAKRAGRNRVAVRLALIGDIRRAPVRQGNGS